MNICVRVCSAVLAAFAFTVWADGQVPAAKRPPAPHTRPQAAPPAVSDAALEKAIQQRFARSKIAADAFQVHVQGGTATLEGRTDVSQHKGTATRMARAAGAVRVVNRIRLSDAARQKAAANLAKGRRRAQVHRGEDRSVRR